MAVLLSKDSSLAEGGALLTKILENACMRPNIAANEAIRNNLSSDAKSKRIRRFSEIRETDATTALTTCRQERNA